jgi:hypothetical protein
MPMKGEPQPRCFWRQHRDIWFNIAGLTNCRIYDGAAIGSGLSAKLAGRLPSTCNCRTKVLSTASGSFAALGFGRDCCPQANYDEREF